MLHWSVDYSSHQNLFEYEKYFTKALEKSLKIEYPHSYTWCKKKYQILPNYWNGFSTHHENYEGAGNIELEKRQFGSLWEVKGIQNNTDSAERTHFHYFAGKGIEGSYQCAVENLNQDGYQSLELEGRIESGRIELHTRRGLSVIEEQAQTLPVYTNWCLLDRLPEQPFSLLENLDSLYREVKQQYLEEWVYKGEILIGYVVSGYGSPFSYYWVNGQGHVVIAAQTLMTYVLSEAEFKGGKMYE